VTSGSDDFLVKALTSDKLDGGFSGLLNSTVSKEEVKEKIELEHTIMKKLMFTLALSALVTMGTQAQKQMGDEHNIEVSFTPFGGSPIDGSTIKYRNFLEDNRAFRLSISIANSSDVHAWYQDGEENEADPVSPQLNINTKSSAIGIAPGYEMHFDGMDNLSPYFGIEVPITLGNRSQTVENWGAQDVTDAQGLELDQYVVWNVGNEQGFNTIGLNLLFGADYYFSDGIYLGFEAGLGFGRTSFGNHTITTDNLTAFNIRFNQAFSSEEAGAEVAGEFVGQLEFDALDENGRFYTDYLENSDGSPYDFPNHISNTTIGNVFQGALRIGFLFD
jgi:hypothetical protein